jgi:hypothetical protein
MKLNPKVRMAFALSFNGRFRQKWLDAHWLLSLSDRRYFMDTVITEASASNC